MKRPTRTIQAADPTVRNRRAAIAVRLLLVPLLLWLLLAYSVVAQAASNRLIADIAGEIIEGLNATKMGQIPAAAGYGAPRIAVKPFAAARYDVSLDEANGYNRHLLAELQRQGRERFRFVARDAQDHLVQEIKDSSTGDAESRLEMLRANLRADILIIGRLTRERDRTLLSYQVVGAENGDLFVSTQPRPLRSEPATESVFHSAAATTTTTPQGRNDEPYRRSVEEAEQLLAELGYFPGSIDGVLTEQTRQALRAYQSDSALPIHGRMTRRVVENMRRDTRLPY